MSDVESAAKHGEIELQHMACAEDGVLRWMSGRYAPDCELYAMPDFGRAPTLCKLKAGPDASVLIEALEAIIAEKENISPTATEFAIAQNRGMMTGKMKRIAKSALAEYHKEQQK